MTSTVSNFFSGDVFLKRQARTRTRRNSVRQQLTVITEQDELSDACSSPTRSSSPLKSLQRRADIGLPQKKTYEDDDDYYRPRPAPRPPMSPKASPDAFHLTFGDSTLAFPHPPLPTPSSTAFSTPVVGPTSPSSTSSCSSAESSGSTSPPTTPSSSDSESELDGHRDETDDFEVVVPEYYYSSSPEPSSDPFVDGFASSLQPFKKPSKTSPRRRSFIRPLFLTRSNFASSSPVSLQQHQIPCLASTSLPLTSRLSDIREEDEDEDSDSEFYAKQFSQVLSLASTLPPYSPLTSSASSSSSSTSISQLTLDRSTRRESAVMPLPLSILSSSPTKRGIVPSAQLDPCFPILASRRRSIAIPAYPPPPPPPSAPATQLVKLEITVTPPDEQEVVVNRRRPRSSVVPSDCEMDVDVEEERESAHGEVDQDAVSAFSFSLYHNSNDTIYAAVELPLTPLTPGSVYSQLSAFHASAYSPCDSRSVFPDSFPSSPVDVDAREECDGLDELVIVKPEAEVPVDVDVGIEEELEFEFDSMPLEYVGEPVQEVELPSREPEEIQLGDAQRRPSLPVIPSLRPTSPIALDDVIKPSLSVYDLDHDRCFTPEPEPASPCRPGTPTPSTPLSSFSFGSDEAATSLQPHVVPFPFDESRVLKSKWSSSTLGSIHDAHGHGHGRMRSSTSTSAFKRYQFAHRAKQPAKPQANVGAQQKHERSPSARLRDYLFHGVTSAGSATNTANTVVAAAAAGCVPPTTPTKLSAKAKAFKRFGYAGVKIPGSTSQPFHHLKSPSMPSPATARWPASPSSPSPISPRPISPRASHRYYYHAHSQQPSPSPSPSRSHSQNHTAVRRQPSVSSSEAGSESSFADSAWSGMSSGSSGLRRKPIPVEMFLRSV